MMASAGITALLKKMDYKDVVIAIDGSLFRYVGLRQFSLFLLTNTYTNIYAGAYLGGEIIGVNTLT